MSTVPVPLMVPGVQDPHDPDRLEHLRGAHRYLAAPVQHGDEELIGTCQKTEERITSAAERSTRLSAVHDREQLKPHHVDDADRAYLDKICTHVGAPDSPESMALFRGHFARELEHREEDAERKQEVAAAT